MHAKWLWEHFLFMFMHWIFIVEQMFVLQTEAEI
jgi:hypothetical protein